MGRPTAKERHGTGSLAADPVKLSLRDKHNLCQYAGLRLEHAQKGQEPTPADRMLRDVEDVLALLPGLKEELGRAPTPKQCAAALHPVERHAEALRLALDALDVRSRALLARPGVGGEDPHFAEALDLDRLRSDLFRVWARAHIAGCQLQPQAEPGTPPPRALEFVSDQLARAFDQANPKGDAEDRTAFVGAVLLVAGHSPEELPLGEYLKSLYPRKLYPRNR